MAILKIGFIVLLISVIHLKAQVAGNVPEATSLNLIEKGTNKKWLKSSWGVPALLIGSGILALTDNDFFSNEEIAKIRNEKLPDFSTHSDDYLQYAPLVAVYGLNMTGIKGKNNFGDRTSILLKSELMMMVLIFPLKSLTHKLRPDGSAHTSFPSGHTAQAFVAATFLHKEYGQLSPWYSIGAYATASTVGVLRVLNNKHYVSDILVGAGIGILTTKLSYLTHQYKWSRIKSTNLSLMPIYYQGNLGIYMNLKF